jgi:hypothetical protein
MTKQELKAEITSALHSAQDNFRDVRADSVFSDAEVLREAKAITALEAFLASWTDIAPYLMLD